MEGNSVQPQAQEKVWSKVKDLTPQSNRVNVLAKVVSVGEMREVPSRYGPPRKVSEVVVGDDTATVTMSLWEDQIAIANAGETLAVDNGFITLFRGHMRLNVGKYGKLEKSDKPLDTVNTELDMSAKEYPREMQDRPSRFDGPRPSYGRTGGGGGGDRGGRFDSGGSGGRKRRF